MANFRSWVDWRGLKRVDWSIHQFSTTSKLFSFEGLVLLKENYRRSCCSFRLCWWSPGRARNDIKTSDFKLFVPDIGCFWWLFLETCFLKRTFFRFWPRQSMQLGGVAMWIWSRIFYWWGRKKVTRLWMFSGLRLGFWRQLRNAFVSVTWNALRDWLWQGSP